MLKNMSRDVRLLPLQQTNSADCCAGGGSLEKEATVGLTDVLGDHLLPRLHLAVQADLAAPPQKVGGENDGGRNAAFLVDPVSLSQVRSDHLEGQKVHSEAGELENVFFFLISFANK